MDDELKGEGNSLNYTYRMHDPRVGRFFATDPLAPSYPHNSPYAFSENRVTNAVELEGLEAHDIGGTYGPYQSPEEYGTVYGPYTDAAAGVANGARIVGSSTFITSLTAGSFRLDNNNHDRDSDAYDGPNNYAKNVSFTPMYSSLLDGFSSMGGGGTYRSRDNEANRLSEYAMSFAAGTSMEGSDAYNDAQMLFNHFVKGDLKDKMLTFSSTSALSGVVSHDAGFLQYAIQFENDAMDYYKQNGSLSGFAATGQIPYLKDSFFTHATLGGVKQIDVLVKTISANYITVMYTFHDRFGAGIDDATSALPGLASMAWLQHVSSRDNPSSKSKYEPFHWAFQINREVIRK